MHFPPAPNLYQAGWCILLLLTVWLHADLSYNTLYVDESGYLFAGERILNAEHWPTKSYVFSSDAPLVVLAVGQHLLGEYGGRIVALCCVYLAAWLIFLSLRLWAVGANHARWAATICCLLPAHILLGQLATYDAICLLMVTLCVYVASRLQRQPSQGLTLVLGLLAVGTILTKYIALAFLPGLFVWCWIYHRRLLATLLFATIVPLAAYITWHWPELNRLVAQQVLGSHAANAKVGYLLNIIFSHTYALCAGIFALLAVTDSAALRRLTKSRHLLVIGGLLLPLPVYHLVTQDAIALHKHMIYTSMGLVVVGVWIVQHVPKLKFMPIFATSIATFLLVMQGFATKERHQYAWPDSSSAQNYLLAAAQPDTTVLSENPYLMRYALRHQTDLRNVQDTSWLDYNQDGSHQPQDVIEALQAGAFDYVYLDDMSNQPLNTLLRRGPLRHGYVLVQDQWHTLSGLVTPVRRVRQSLYRRLPNV
ncbi:MAG: hypothetical protein AAF529_11620 [Pseudomonadota bacterium]